MNTSQQPHPRFRRLAYLLATMALLAAGYAGLQLAPTIQATAGAASSGQLAIQCPSLTTHC